MDGMVTYNEYSKDGSRGCLPLHAKFRLSSPQDTTDAVKVTQPPPYLLELPVQIRKRCQELSLVLVGGLAQVFFKRQFKCRCRCYLVKFDFGYPTALMDFCGDEVARGIVHRLTKIVFVIAPAAVQFAANSWNDASKSFPGSNAPTCITRMGCYSERSSEY